jgi:hypothetical protein
MSAPSQFGPSPPSSGGGLSTLLIVVLVIVGALALACCGICSGCMFLGQRAVDVAKKVAEDELNYFFLQPAFLTALGAVLEDSRVSDRLGEPIQNKEESSRPYRRTSTGEVNPAGEIIQFDIRGPKGTAIVSVVATQGETESAPYRASKITVTFSDGSVLDIEPPKDQSLIPSEPAAKGETDVSK